MNMTVTIFCPYSASFFDRCACSSYGAALASGHIWTSDLFFSILSTIKTAFFHNVIPPLSHSTLHSRVSFLTVDYSKGQVSIICTWGGTSIYVSGTCSCVRGYSLILNNKSRTSPAILMYDNVLASSISPLGLSFETLQDFAYVRYSHLLSYELRISAHVFLLIVCRFF